MIKLVKGATKNKLIKKEESTVVDLVIYKQDNKYIIKYCFNYRIINNMNWLNKNVIINKGKCYYEHKSRVIWKNC